MAMTQCKECKKEVSKSASKCPHCGVSNPGVTPEQQIIGFIVMISVFGFIWWQMQEDKPFTINKPVSNSKPAYSLPIPAPVKEEVFNVKIEDLTVNKKIKNAWSIKGKVRNLENKLLKGYVKIKFQDSKGDILKSAMAPVNGNDYLKPNQAGIFEYFTEPSDFKNVTNYDVIFVGKNE